VFLEVLLKPENYENVQVLLLKRTLCSLIIPANVTDVTF